MAVNIITPSDLAAVISLSLDARPSGNLYHGWRVALIAYAMGADMTPSERADLFMAGLLHDVACVGLSLDFASFHRPPKQPADSRIRTHPVIGAATLRQIPGFIPIADIIEYHHEWWDGSGYPRGLMGEEISLPAQYIRIADAANLKGCFAESGTIRESLQKVNVTTGTEWSTDVWAKFLSVLTDGSITKDIVRDMDLPKLMSGVLSEISSAAKNTKSDTLDVLFTLFSDIVDAYHGSSGGHSARVTEWATTFGKALNLSAEDQQKLKWAACSHDAGKMAISAVLLDKSGKLSKDELETIRSHADLTVRLFRLLDSRSGLAEIGEIAGAHHERYDGKGYPKGLARDGIPFLSRILAVADAYDAMTSPRAYRLGLPPGVAVQRLQMNSGTQFDPDVVDAVADLYQRDLGKFLSATVPAPSLVQI